MFNIVTAYAEPAAGPGWSNSPVYVIYRDESGVLKSECIQPDQQSKEMQLLYRMSAEINYRMVTEANKILNRKGAGKK